MCKTLTSLARRAAAALIAAPLMFGAVSLPTIATAAPASVSVHAEHGVWESFSLTSDSGVSHGVMTKMSKGGTVAVILDGDSITLYLTDPAWDLEPDQKVRVRVGVDRDTLTGTAFVASPTVIEMRGLTRRALSDFVEGANAVIDVGNGSIVWSLDLHGFTAAMSDALRLYKASYR
jgi:hypothetical protein